MSSRDHTAHRALLLLAFVFSLSIGVPKGNAAVTLPDSDWPSYNRSLSSERYSPLREIDSRTVAKLHPICTAELGEVSSMQSGPLVVNGILYLTSATSTFAIDAKDCHMLWQQKHDYGSPSLDLKVNRGAAYADGRLFRGALDGTFFSLDAKTGRELWSVKLGDGTKGESFTSAPIVWNDVVFVGNAIGDAAGVRGTVRALDAKSGRVLWSFDLIPTHGPGSETWGGNSLPTGAGTWTSYTLDEKTGLLYVPAGNPAPDFLLDERAGANLYANSVVVLDARSGKLVTFYKLVPDDFHDWDVSATPTIVMTAANRRLALAPTKNGYVYGLDTDGDKIRYQTPVTTRENVDAPLTAEGTRFCPGTNGGVEWNGAAYLPSQNTFFVNAVDWCTTVSILPDAQRSGHPPALGAPWGGSSDPSNPFGKIVDGEGTGWLTAFDADSGEIRWKYHSKLPLVAGVTATASGLVMTAELTGDFVIFDAPSGKELFRSDVGQPVGGGVISYAIEGHQRVAVVSGLKNLIFHTDSGPAKVTVFGL